MPMIGLPFTATSTCLQSNAIYLNGFWPEGYVYSMTSPTSLAMADIENES
jgi:hypothetical protein